MKNKDNLKEKGLTYQIGQRIMRLRKSKKITQGALTKKVGYRMNPNTVSVIERGIGDPKISTLHAIAEALEINLSELLDIDSINARSTSSLDQQLFYVRKLLNNMTEEEREKVIRILSVI